MTLVDPAMGTGTFLLEVFRSLADTVAEDQGEGAVGPAVAAALSRIIGFEIQLGPFAVAQLRILAEAAEFGLTSIHPESVQTFVTNTLDNPFVEEESLGSWYEPIAHSHREANRIKKDEPVMVVLGNPPYKERSHGEGGWIESGTPEAGHPAPLARFIPPADWAWAHTSSTSTTHTSTSGGGRRGRSSTTTPQPTAAWSASSASPDSWTARASSECASTCAVAATPSG